MFEVMDANIEDVVIRVIGVGNCGCNAVDYMIENGVRGVEFLSINTEVDEAKQSKIHTQLTIAAPIQLLNESNTLDVATNDRLRISERIKGAHMVFVIAGIGGGTGTVIAPVVSQIAKEMQVFTLAVVTTPFASEVEHRGRAQKGIEELRKHVDTLIIVPNSKLMGLLDSDITVPEAFKASNGALQSAVAGIAEVITVSGLVNVDMADVRTVLSAKGMAILGFAIAAGPDRARTAAEFAIASAFLEDLDMSGAHGVLVNITSSNDLRLKEIYDVMTCVQFAAPEATVVVGSVFDESMGDKLSVTIIAAGLMDEAATE